MRDLSWLADWVKELAPLAPIVPAFFFPGCDCCGVEDLVEIECPPLNGCSLPKTLTMTISNSGCPNIPDGEYSLNWAFGNTYSVEINGFDINFGCNPVISSLHLHLDPGNECSILDRFYIFNAENVTCSPFSASISGVQVDDGSSSCCGTTNGTFDVTITT